MTREQAMLWGALALLAVLQVVLLAALALRLRSTTRRLHLAQNRNRNQVEAMRQAAAATAYAQAQVIAIQAATAGIRDRVDELRAALGSHAVWDSGALLDLRARDANYPTPPPFPHDFRWDG